MNSKDLQRLHNPPQGSITVLNMFPRKVVPPPFRHNKPPVFTEDFAPREAWWEAGLQSALSMAIVVCLLVAYKVVTGNP